MGSAFVVFNPRATKAPNEGDLNALLMPLRDKGWSVTLRCTTAPGSATAIAEEAVASGHDVVIAAGGDGTVNEVVQVLAQTPVALGVLPLGMENIWAATIGLQGPKQAVDALGVRRIRTIDLGVADWGDGSKRYFVLMAGVGFDATVVRATGSRFKRSLGRYAFVANAFRTGLNYGAFEVALDVPGDALRQQALMLVVGNSPLYAAGIRITSRARLDDALLDVCLFRGRGLFRMARHAIALLAGHHLADPAVRYYQTAHTMVRAKPPQPVQLDGELAGTTPVEFRVVPLALRVIVP